MRWLTPWIERPEVGRTNARGRVADADCVQHSFDKPLVRLLTDFNAAGDTNIDCYRSSTLSYDLHFELCLQDRAFRKRKAKFLHRPEAITRSNMQQVSVAALPKAFCHPDSSNTQDVMSIERFPTFLLKHLQIAHRCSFEKRFVLKQDLSQGATVELDHGGGASSNAKPTKRCFIAKDVAVDRPKFNRGACRMAWKHGERFFHVMAAKNGEHIRPIILKCAHLDMIPKI